MTFSTYVAGKSYMHFSAVDWHDSLPSTNTFLKDRVSDDPGLCSGQVVATLRQTAGRGRYSRTWMASAHRDLTFSFLLRAEVEFRWMPLLPMAVSLGVSDYLRHLGIPAEVKWPNDVVVAGRKICGILSEFLPGAGPPPAVVVGVGLNLGMTPKEAARIDRPATSVRMERGHAPEPKVALEALLPAISPWIDRWRVAGYAGLCDAWEARVIGRGREATVGEGARQRHGVIEGFGNGGELLLREADGRVAVITMGDVVLQG